jgi:hypothetical protein
MRLEDANALLDPGYPALESGYRRLEDGQLHVAACAVRSKGKATHGIAPVPIVGGGLDHLE